MKVSTRYVDDNYVYKTNSSGQYSEKYIKQDGMTVVQNINGVKQSMHPDHLGSTSLILDSNGNTVENSWYSPFGETVGGGEKSRFDYESKEYDNAVKDIDFHFRKYRPDWGKFTQPDTLLVDIYNPQNLNRCSFEGNNPVKTTDETGHCPWCVAASVGFVASSLSYMFTHSGSGWEHVGKTFAAGVALLYFVGIVVYIKYLFHFYSSRNSFI